MFLLLLLFLCWCCCLQHEAAFEDDDDGDDIYTHFKTFTLSRSNGPVPLTDQPKDEAQLAAVAFSNTMHDYPAKLEDLCLDEWCYALDAACSHDDRDLNLSLGLGHLNDQEWANVDPPNKPAPGNDGQQLVVDGSPGSTTLFASGGVNSIPLKLSCSLAYRLIRRLCEKGLLNDRTMRYFSASRTCLKNVWISNASLSSSTLDVLAEHVLQSLQLINVDHLDLDYVLSERCLNQETRRALRTLNLQGTLRPVVIRGDSMMVSGTDHPNVNIVDTVSFLTYFTNLRSLCVADTRFGDAGLRHICEHLHFLEYLDISHTVVHDVQPLTALKDCLVTLVMYKLKVRNVPAAVSALCILHNLRVLDISYVNKGIDASCIELGDDDPLDIDDASAASRPEAVVTGPAAALTKGMIGVTLIKMAVNCLPKLTVLDISGNQGAFDAEDFRNFLVHHPGLKFFGLLMTSACFFDSLNEYRSLKVAGNANKEQIFTSLQTYVSRDLFCSRSLYLVFRILQENYAHLSSEDKDFCIKYILDGLQSNLKSVSVQMAGTACLYNFCRGERAKTIHPALMRRIVAQLLASLAHQRHSNILQLHKNVWLTLCNDHILQSSAFDMFQCCRAALESMITCNDNSVTRMAVAIVSILAAKIRTDLTALLGSNPAYIRYLLSLVSQKVKAQQQMMEQNRLDEDLLRYAQQFAPFDVTLRFTLSALFNLTDESPSTCLCFLDEGGLEVALDTLSIVEDQSVETKVLGLLNNVAEVPELKPRLVNQRCLQTVCRFLNSPKIDVSYFAAGILAHLCAELRWSDPSPTSEECLICLRKTISCWDASNTDMVAYRSFKPFFSLLSKDHLRPVQLWAVWAIRHVCSKNTERYAEMFKQESGREAVECVRQSAASDSLIVSICDEILALLS